MSGFAQVAGTAANDRARWTWDLKTVNAKGLDLRLRLPPGFDRSEGEMRRRIGARLTRGTCHAALGVSWPAGAGAVRVDTDRLNSLLEVLATLSVPTNVRPASLDGLLAVRGIVETTEDVATPEEQEMLVVACERGLDAALDALVAMREREGQSLHAVLGDRLAAIGELTHRADKAPQRQPEAVRAKLAAAIRALAEGYALDPDRLHQEALLLAAKADVREELDRLAGHVAVARELLAAGGPIGRRLDFLAQELAREASTFCAKANDGALTAIGLDLRVEIEQFREQVQNVE